jgi:hypothetical protein
MLKLLTLFIKNPTYFYRYTLLPKIYYRSDFLRTYGSLSKLQKHYGNHLKRYKVNWNSDNNKTILVQSVSDYEMCLKIASSGYLLSKKHQANLAFYSAEYREKSYGNNFLNYLARTKLKTNLDKIYLSFAGKLLYRNNDRYKNQIKINELVSSILPTLKTKQDVLNIHINGIKVGDLLYDTYLRYADKPQLDVNDPYLKTLLEQTFNIFYISKQNIETQNIIALVSSYTTYIYHGLVVRICLQKNIPVYTVGAYYSLIHKVSNEYPSHANNHFDFKKLFLTVPNKKEILETYTPVFEARFKGVIDSATSYMKQSAFSESNNKELDNIDWNNTVVVLAHCFFDSPHIYRDLIFPDFYDWLTFTLDALTEQKNLTILVKQHPNGLIKNDEIFEELKQKYINSKILFIDKKTSQLQIINNKPKAIITAYGTAAAEFSYLNFPVITVYDNPFTNYDFTHLANTISEYKLFLDDVINLQPKTNKSDIIEYYYMQYFYFLQGRDINYLNCAKYKGQTFSDSFLKDYLPNLNPEFFKMLDSAMEDGFMLIELEGTL